MCNVKLFLCMGGGDGETNYAKNSLIQDKAISRTKPIVEEAIKEVYNSLNPKSLVVADLGCSSGPNTFLVISEIVEAIGDHCRKLGHNPPEIQYILNDLPGNDFNTLFDYSEKFKEKLKEVEEEVVPYVVGVPGSFYGRLFPQSSVHFIHSSYSLHWLSQVPQGLKSDTGLPLNKRNIYIAKSSPQIVAESYLKQFQMGLFSISHVKILITRDGGPMILIFFGKDDRTKAPCGELSSCFGLLADALNAMVLEGIMNEAKVEDFNLPIYAASMEEVMTIVETIGLFHVEQVEIFETNWDPFDDSSDDDESAFDNFASGKNVVNCSIRAVVEPMFEKYFGEAIMDELFSRYAKNVAKHLLGEKGKHVVFMMALRK
uniref:Carboxyl methyltransferase n=1 Tax=Crocus sativus TaxID=82528 RepID=Q70SZ8_CROSA|nr:carboxyl methyltransferase [Crocus sativus]